MSDHNSILPETPPSLRDHDFLWWTIGAAVLVGYLIPKLIAARRQLVPKHPNTGKTTTRKSRLLQDKFGRLIEKDGDDGQQALQLKDVTDKTGAAVVVGVVSAEESSSLSDAPHDQQQQQLQVTTSTTTKAEQKAKKKPSHQKKNAAVSAQSQTHIVFQNTTDRHPGLEAFRYWWDVQTSLYRIYTLTRSNGQASDPPPYNPSSRRGKTSVDVRVTNETDDALTVFWINYTGGHEDKGTIPPGHTWMQSTWIDHPWVFANANSNNNNNDAVVVVAHYIPYKIIPNVVPEAPTVDLTTTVTAAGVSSANTNDHGGDAPSKKTRLIGIHRFSIVNLPENIGNDNDDRRQYTHWIRDDILPQALDITTEQQALELSLLHCVRTGYYHWKTLMQYWTKIQQAPDEARYRQIRIANRTFSDAVWNTAARGVFLCSGWVEHGAYVELGLASRPYKTNDLFRIIATIQRWWKRAEDESSFGAAEQPEGADGYGRAGFQ